MSTSKSALSTEAKQKKEFTDPLKQKPQSPERVFYELGILLGADDFRAEQLYHRGRLARALSYLDGSGTVAGLLVERQEPLKPVPEPGSKPEFPKGREEQLIVHPGIAIDRLGRFIEVPASACIRLNRWYEAQEPDTLIKALHPKFAGDKYNGVVVDLFIRFFACESGKTPSFAVGPFDALDAVQPSRLKDFYKLELIARQEETPPLPRNRWPDLSGVNDADERWKKLQEAIFDSWREGKEGENRGWSEDGLAPLREHALNQDPTSLFLARLILPAAAAEAEGARPARDMNLPVEVDNFSRAFVYTAGAIASWLGLKANLE